MGKGRRRNTARTGDKALYSARNNADGNDGSSNNVIARGRKAQSAASSSSTMYDEIDQYHNDRDENFLRLKADQDSDSEDEKETVKALMGYQEHVLDLGIGGGSDDDNEDDDSDSSDHEDEDDLPEVQNKTSDDDSSGDSDDHDDSSDDDDDILGRNEDLQLDHMDPRNWGTKKSMYYHGDTADLEIGQDEVDAYEEEEAAKEVQASRYQQMDEDDFALSDEDEKAAHTMEKGGIVNRNDDQYMMPEKMQTTRDTSKLSQRDARKLLKKQYPELIPMTSYFLDVVRDLHTNTDVAVKALFEGESRTAESIGATRQGQLYLLTKVILQKSIALNSIMYLLVRSTTSGGDKGILEIQSHPVMSQLKSLNSMLQKFEDQVEKNIDGIDKQMEYLVKAAALVGDGDEDEDEKDDTDGDDSLDETSSKEDRSDKLNENQFTDDEEEDDTDDERKILPASRKKHHQQQDFQNTLTEARFGFRPSDVGKHETDKRKRKHDSYADDFGDLDDNEMPSRSSNALASTINRIEQRSDTASRKRRPAPVAEELDELDDEADDQLARGIQMMEEEMGKIDDLSDEETGRGMNGKGKNYVMDHQDDMGDDMQFYKNAATKSQTKKSIKKGLYSVAPKFPRKDAELDGERAISRTILKNRGLVAHKAKINRNPRVKKREQYRKALIRRKGAVREVRHDEGHRYGGEETGIKSGISRSRKLSRK